MLEVLNLNENNCADCYKCIRTCSVKAITYANNTAEIVHDEVSPGYLARAAAALQTTAETVGTDMAATT